MDYSQAIMVYTYLYTLNIDTVLVQLMLPAYEAVECVTVSSREIPPRINVNLPLSTP